MAKDFIIAILHSIFGRLVAKVSGQPFETILCNRDGGVRIYDIRNKVRDILLDAAQ